MTSEEALTTERINAFSDGVFAVIITIPVLELRPPKVMTFCTAWIAGTRPGAVPVAVYAGVFLLVNVTYALLCMEAVHRSAPHKVAPRVRSMMRTRSFATLSVFVDAGVVALRYPMEAWR